MHVYASGRSAGPGSHRRHWLTILTLCGAFVMGTMRPLPVHAADDAAADAAREARGLELFKGEVRALLVSRCFKCHGGEEVESEFDLTDRARLLKGGIKGAAIVPGKAEESLLFKLVSQTRKPFMPMDEEPLSAAEVKLIADWINHGAPYDSPLTAGAPSWTEKKVDPETRRFWSFQPLKRVEPPAVSNLDWCRTPIDRFILAQLEAKQIAPNPPVDRRQLIRRAFFDLIGLPPTPEEVEAFVNDTRTDAYEKLLDALMARPQYGERWARHWLDIARFAESHGFEHDYDRPTAYHYRDFVIQALNQDLPFNTFVHWQLAGDEYAPDNNLALMATGFLAAGVHSTQITKNEVEKHRYDEMDDMLATVGTSMLGLTIGCARCHDHKFDPIPQNDYYRLLTTFTTTVRSEVDLTFDREKYEQAKAAFDQQHAPYVAALAKYESEKLAPRLTELEKAAAAELEQGPWIILDRVTAKSAGGATFTPQSDGSLAAGGTNAQFETYTVTVETDLTGIASLRLEALADPSLKQGGPGRADNGNFDLTDLKVTIAPKADAAKAMPVSLQNPRATFEQPGLPIAATIDADEKSGWAVDPEFGKDHAAAFALASPVGFPGGSLLTFTLKFNGNDRHNIGRLRLAVATGSPDLRGNGIPEKVAALLKAPVAERTAEQQAAVIRWFGGQDAGWKELDAARAQHAAQAPQPNIAKVLISTEGLPAVRLHTQGADFLEATHFLKRGDTEHKEGVAQLGFLQVLMKEGESPDRWQESPPAGWRTSYRRRALAEWLTDTEHGAGQLLARVIVNRLWQFHLGRGIVATPSDFGTRGERPTHPELLDWLATELIAGNWQLKPLHKQIMLSAVYQQSSRNDPAKLAADPDNRLFWRRPGRRLEAEVIRDSLLAVSGRLDPKMFGPGTLDEASQRRSIYFTVKRSRLVPMMQVFDCPDALQGVAERPSTTIAPQALLLMNNPQIRLSARACAARIKAEVGTDDWLTAITRGFQITVSRPPRAEELSNIVQFLEKQQQSYQSAGKGDARELALTDFCQILMCLNEFVYVE